MKDNIYNVKKIGDIEVKITDNEVVFFNKGKKIFSLCPFKLRLQEMSGIIRDSFTYYGLNAAEEFSVIAGWIKVNT